MPVTAVKVRNLDGLPYLDDEKIVHTEKDCTLVFGHDHSKGTGTLFVTTKNLIWLSESAGYSIDWPTIIIHAICSDQESFPQPCLYCQLDIEGPDDSSEDEAEQDEAVDGGRYEEEHQPGNIEIGAADVVMESSGDHDSDITKKRNRVVNELLCNEIRFVPKDKKQLEDVFKACCECALLNPDPDQGNDEDQGDFFFDADEVHGQDGEGAEGQLDEGDEEQFEIGADQNQL